MTKELPAHAVIRPLGAADVDRCVELESRAFPEAERASKDKISYRFRVCPELCAGVFIREFKTPSNNVNDPSGDSSVHNHTTDKDEDYEDIEDENLPHGTSLLASERLIAHILATKMTTEFVTDEAMMIPDLDEYGRLKDPKDPRGHHEEGRTIGIHALAVDPDFQRRSIGTILLKDYIQRITTQHIADRISIIAHEHLLPFYNRVGFEDNGPSKVQFGGGGWRDVWVALSATDDDEEEA